MALRHYLLAGALAVLMAGCHKGSQSPTAPTQGGGSAQAASPGLSISLLRGDEWREGEPLVLSVRSELFGAGTAPLNWRVLSDRPTFPNSSGSRVLTEINTRLEIASAADQTYQLDQPVVVRFWRGDETTNVIDVQVRFRNIDPVPFLTVGNASSRRGGTLEFPVELSHPSHEVIEYRWATQEITARRGEDFVGSDGAGVIPARTTKMAVRIATVVGSQAPTARTMSLVVSDLRGAQARDPAGVGTIEAGESLESRVGFATPEVRIDGRATSYTLELVMDALSPRDVSIQYEVAGTLPLSNHSLRSGQVVIPAGQKSIRWTTQLTPLAKHDGDKDLIVRLTGSVNAGLSAVREFRLVVPNTHPVPQVAVNDALATVGEALQFTVTLNEASGRDVVVNYRTRRDTAQLDQFVETYGTLTIPPDSVRASVTVPTRDSGEYLEKATLFLDLLEVLQGQVSRGVGRGTIVGRTAPPLVEFTQAFQAIGPGTRLVRLVLRLSKSSRNEALVPFRVSGDAVVGVDHNLTSGVIAIPAGQTEASINFNRLFPGSVATGTRRVRVELQEPTGATLWNQVATDVDLQF